MKTALGVLAILIGIYSYIPYFHNIFAGKTKPHAFSWFVWFLLTAIAFFAQLDGKGGAGAWVTGFTALVSLCITIAAVKVGRQNIAGVDWLFFAGSMLSLALWAITKNPVGSVILITVIDAMAFFPTFRKSYHKPHEETALTYSLSAVKFAVSLAALGTISVTTALYPFSLVVTNGLFVALVLWRRNQLKGNAPVPF